MYYEKIVKGIKCREEWYFRQGSVLLCMPTGKRTSPSDDSNKETLTDKGAVHRGMKGNTRQKREDDTIPRP